MIRKTLFILIGLIVVTTCSRDWDNPFDAKTTARFGISIDAQKDDFYRSLTGPDDGYVVIPNTAFVAGNGPMPESLRDLSASVWTAWDDTYFYFYAEVNDDIVSHSNADRTWKNDGLELKVDADPSLRATAGVLSFNMTAVDSQHIAPSFYGTVVNIGATSFDDYARVVLRNGYILEFRLAWDRVNHGDGRFVVPEVGSVIGMAINFHENDGTGDRVGSIQWSSSLDDNVARVPSLLGTVELKEDNKLSYRPVSPITGVSVHQDLAIYDPTTWPEIGDL